MLDSLLRRLVRGGTLGVTWPNGRRTVYGDAAASTDGTDVEVRLIGRWTPLRIALDPDLRFGEAYMDGSLRIERGTLWDLMDLLARSPTFFSDGRMARLLRPLSQLLFQSNSRRASRSNVARHYDLPGELYRLFLDEDMQYSCAYFSRPDLDLDAAQEAKKRHLAAKLLLRPGQRVLDIGCGWGGLALAIARAADVEVLGITLSREQLEIARRRAAEAGLSDRARFEAIDYRDVTGPFDRIVSVGMFEHVGVPNYAKFFERVKELLTPSGVALLHSIGKINGPAATSHWIRKYIFPGGYIPALSQVLPSVERCGLWMTDLEVLRLHYAETLKAWRERFAAGQAVIERIRDKSFCRMWEFYLVASEVSFRRGGFMVFQMQLARDIAAVPLTRDYMFEAERAAAGRRVDASSCTIEPFPAAGRRGGAAVS